MKCTLIDKIQLRGVFYLDRYFRIAVIKAERFSVLVKAASERLGIGISAEAAQSRTSLACLSLVSAWLVTGAREAAFVSVFGWVCI